MVDTAVALWRLDRQLLAIYLIAICGLLMYPFVGPELQSLSIGIDKWVHILLFGGLAVFIRWNLTTIRYAVLFSVGGAFVVAVAIEFVQGLVPYRSAELMDLLAALIGAVLGALAVNRLVSLPVPEESIGLIVKCLGIISRYAIRFCRRDRRE